ncbi:hypothetical protein Hanom_Chr03g00253911 [Helianthus anomalus]
MVAASSPSFAHPQVISFSKTLNKSPFTSKSLISFKPTFKRPKSRFSISSSGQSKERTNSE